MTGQKTPFFSIIIPTLNEEKFLPPLLESLTTQTYRDFEVIVCDGLSADNTIKAAKEFEKRLPGLKIVKSPKAHLSTQRNYGAKNATGQWFIHMDADNILLPYCLERCRKFIEADQPQFFTTWFMPDSSKSGDVFLNIISIIFIEAALTVKRQIAPGPFNAIRRELFEQIGGFDENRNFGEDQDISMRLYERGVNISVLRETLYIYSLRRFRKQGTLRVFQQYAIGGSIALLTRRSPKNLSGYIMGGHLYEKPKNVRKSVLLKYEDKLRNFIKEIFEG